MTLVVIPYPGDWHMLMNYQYPLIKAYFDAYLKLELFQIIVNAQCWVKVGQCPLVQPCLGAVLDHSHLANANFTIQTSNPSIV